MIKAREEGPQGPGDRVCADAGRRRRPDTMDKRKLSKMDLFGEAPVGKALLTMAIPTVISQLILPGRR